MKKRGKKFVLDLLSLDHVVTDIHNTRENPIEPEPSDPGFPNSVKKILIIF